MTEAVVTGSTNGVDADLGHAENPAQEMQDDNLLGDADDADSDGRPDPADAADNNDDGKNLTSNNRCRHWARGHCHLADRCRFEHSGPKGKGPAPARKPRSNYQPSYNRGTRFPRHMAPGRMMHGGMPMQQIPIQQYQSPEHAKRTEGNTSCRHWSRGFCNVGDSCKFSHAGDPGLGGRPSEGPSSCRHWMRHGYCLMADTCRFKHNPNEAATGDQGKSREGSQQDGSKRGKAPCRHFAKGYCQLGDSCHFHHNGIQRIGNPAMGQYMAAAPAGQYMAGAYDPYSVSQQQAYAAAAQYAQQAPANGGGAAGGSQFGAGGPGGAPQPGGYQGQPQGAGYPPQGYAGGAPAVAPNGAGQAQPQPYGYAG